MIVLPAQMRHCRVFPLCPRNNNIMMAFDGDADDDGANDDNDDDDDAGANDDDDNDDDNDDNDDDNYDDENVVERYVVYIQELW
jgi:hypothetical protein